MKNYSVVVGIVIFLATVTWFTNARHNYQSPEITENKAHAAEEPVGYSGEKDIPKNEAYVVESEAT